MIFGQTHHPMDTNPYFISLASTETTGFAVSMQSSISSQKLVEVWWEVEAKLERSDGTYSVSGTLRNDTYLDKNLFSGSSVESDSDRCSFTSGGFIWKFEVNTSTFSGTISAKEATFSIEGSIPDENTNRLISYVIQFDGKWDSKSAELSLDKPTPTWPKPGNPDAPGAQQPQVSSILVDTDPAPTVDSSSATYDTEKNIDGPAKDTERKIGAGGISAITTAVIFFLGFIIMVIFCVIQQRKRQQDEKVHLEIAYIYPGPRADSSEGYSEILAHYNSNLEMREVLVNYHSLPVTNQHQWREF